MKKISLLIVGLVITSVITACTQVSTIIPQTNEAQMNTISAPTKTIPTSTKIATPLPTNTPLPPTETVIPTNTPTATFTATPTIDEILLSNGLERTPDIDTQCNCTSWALPNKSLKVFFMPDHTVLISAFTTKEVENNAQIIETILFSLYLNDMLVAKIVEAFMNGGSTHSILAGDAHNALIMYPSSDSIAFMISDK